MQLVYLAAVREALAMDSEPIEIPAGVRTVGDLIDHMAHSHENHAKAFADRGRLRFALDQKMVKLDASLDGASELAIFPPVTGG